MGKCPIYMYCILEMSIIVMMEVSNKKKNISNVLSFPVKLFTIGFL